VWRSSTEWLMLLTRIRTSIGRFTALSHLRIFARERLLSHALDALILTALDYCDEIIRQLRDDLKFEGTIAVLGPRLQVLQNEFTPSETAAL
jgi:hypothetical protein